MTESWLAPRPDDPPGTIKLAPPTRRILAVGPTDSGPALEGEVVEVLDPPEGWGYITATVMTNADWSCNTIVAGLLEEPSALGSCWAQHVSLRFHGKVWPQDGMWYEQVWVHHQAVATYSADNLKDLMITVNNRHGWE